MNQNDNDEKTFLVIEKILQLIGNDRIEIEGDKLTHSDIFTLRTKYSGWITSRLLEIKDEWKKKKDSFITINIKAKGKLMERWAIFTREGMNNNAINLIILLRAIKMKLKVLKMQKSKDNSLEIKLEKKIISSKFNYKFNPVVYNSTYEVSLDWIEDENTEKIEIVPESIPRTINNPPTKPRSNSSTSESPYSTSSFSGSNPIDIQPPFERLSVNSPNSPTSSFSPGNFVGSPNYGSNMMGTPPNLSISPFKRSLTSIVSPRKSYPSVMKGMDQKEVFEELVDIAHSIRNDNKRDSFKEDSLTFGLVHDDNGVEDFKQFCINNLKDSSKYLEELDQNMFKSFGEQAVKNILSQINEL